VREVFHSRRFPPDAALLSPTACVIDAHLSVKLHCEILRKTPDSGAYREAAEVAG